MIETKEVLFVNQWDDETEKEKAEDEVESLDEVAEEEEKEEADSDEEETI